MQEIHFCGSFIPPTFVHPVNGARGGGEDGCPVRGLAAPRAHSRGGRCPGRAGRFHCPARGTLKAAQLRGAHSSPGFVSAGKGPGGPQGVGEAVPALPTFGCPQSSPAPPGSRRERILWDKGAHYYYYYLFRDSAMPRSVLNALRMSPPAVPSPAAEHRPGPSPDTWVPRLGGRSPVSPVARLSLERSSVGPSTCSPAPGRRWADARDPSCHGHCEGAGAPRPRSPSRPSPASAPHLAARSVSVFRDRPPGARRTLPAPALGLGSAAAPLSLSCRVCKGSGGSLRGNSKN